VQWHELVADLGCAVDAVLVISFDMDHFKYVNDEFGQVKIADDVLKALTDSQSKVNDGGCFNSFRWGEFIVILRVKNHSTPI